MVQVAQCLPTHTNPVGHRNKFVLQEVKAKDSHMQKAETYIDDDNGVNGKYTLSTPLKWKTIKTKWFVCLVGVV